MADSLLVFVPHEQAHGARSILKDVGILSPDRTKARPVENEQAAAHSNEVQIFDMAIHSLKYRKLDNGLAVLQKGLDCILQSSDALFASMLSLQCTNMAYRIAS